MDVFRDLLEADPRGPGPPAADPRSVAAQLQPARALLRALGCYRTRYREHAVALHLAYPGWTDPRYAQTLRPVVSPRRVYRLLALLRTPAAVQERHRLGGSQRVCWWCGATRGPFHGAAEAPIAAVVDAGGYCRECLPEALALRDPARAPAPRLARRYVPSPFPGILADEFARRLSGVERISYRRVELFSLFRANATTNPHRLVRGGDAPATALWSLYRIRRLHALPAVQLVAAQVCGIGWQCLGCEAHGALRPAEGGPEFLPTDFRVLCRACADRAPPGV